MSEAMEKVLSLLKAKRGEWIYFGQDGVEIRHRTWKDADGVCACPLVACLKHPENGCNAAEPRDLGAPFGLTEDEAADFIDAVDGDYVDWDGPPSALELLRRRIIHACRPVNLTAEHDLRLAMIEA